MRASHDEHFGVKKEFKDIDEAALMLKATTFVNDDVCDDISGEGATTMSQLTSMATTMSQLSHLTSMATTMSQVRATTMSQLTSMATATTSPVRDDPMTAGTTTNDDGEADDANADADSDADDDAAADVHDDEP